MGSHTPSPHVPPLVFDRSAQVKAGILTIAFIAAFWQLLDFLPPNLGSLVYPWLHESDWSHGPIIPLFSIWLVYNRWDRIRRCPVRHTWVGLVIMVAGLVIYQFSLWAVRIGYIRPMAMLLCLLGVILYLRGLPILRHIWIPWAYLLFAIPLPKRVYFALTDPLRRMAATVSTGFLALVSPVDHIERQGSLIEYVYHGKVGTIGVADACSGMRSTITLCALGVAVTFLSERPWWQRVLMVGACVPIAVFCNFIRVTVTSVLYIFVDPKYASGTYHTALGLVTILLAFAIFSGLGWVLDHLVVEAPDTADETP